MVGSDVKRLKELEEENRRLKQMYAERSRYRKLLKDVIERKLKRQPFDENWWFTSSRRMVSASVEPVESLASVTCGPVSAGYLLE